MRERDERKKGATRQTAGVLTRAHRQACGLTQRQLATKAGVSLGALQDLEQGRTVRPRQELLARLAEALQLSPSQYREFVAVPEKCHAASPHQPNASADEFPELRVEVLGPLALWRRGQPVDVVPVRQRAVLGLLALHADTHLHRTAIVSALWGEDPPATADAMIQAQVSRIRRLMEPGRGWAGNVWLSWDGSGYRLSPGSVQLDVTDFGELTRHARQAAAAGNLTHACEWYERALRLWRGQALDDIDVLRGHPAVIGLNRWRDTVVIEYAAAAAGVGLEDQVISHLEALAAREPLDERSHAHLMVTLAALGRQAEALRVYQALAGRLDSDLGVRPGPELTAAHLRVLRQEVPVAAGAGTLPVQVASPPHEVVPRQLPPAALGFAGRRSELAVLSDLLDQAARPGGTVVISAIGGMAGVGKTALAVQWAHLTADRFPDGQLYVNLRGFGPSDSPMTSAEAVRLFLDGLGVVPERVPVGLDAQAALYRSLLADKRMLVVLDNAHDPGQLRPLLPAAPGCLVLVTSRNQLTGLAAGEGAHLVCLDVLNEAEAREMLAQRLGRSRVAEEPATVTELIRLCARLPLALSIAAARAAARPGLSLATVAAELRDVRVRLDALSTGEAATDVRTVFSWSFRQLSTPAARMFRLLGVHPGPDITAPAAASLAGAAQIQADQALAELEHAHLITEHAPGRFTCHDLVRAYAAERARDLSQAQRHAATRRMLDHYLHTAYEASFLIAPYRGSVPLDPAQPRVRPERLGERRHAMAWFLAERQVLLAVIGQAAADREFSVHAWQLPWAVAIFLDWAGYWQDLAVTQRAALAAASWTQDRPAQAEAHHSLGRAHMRMGAFAQSRAHVTAALELGQQLGNGLVQARAQYNLSRICELQGSTHDALSHAEQALRLYRAARNRSGEANALNSVGWLCAQLGRYDEALHSCEQSLALLREQRNPVAEAGALDSLGYIHYHLGNNGEAISCCRQANEVLGNSSDLQLRTEILTHLGDAYQASGDTGAARRAWQQALDILEDLHHPDAEQIRSRLGRRPDRSINGGVTSATGRNPGC